MGGLYGFPWEGMVEPDLLKAQLSYVHLYSSIDVKDTCRVLTKIGPYPKDFTIYGLNSGFCGHSCANWKNGRYRRAVHPD